jgi:hypothetical protein
MGLGVSTKSLSGAITGLGSLLGLGAAAIIVICAIPTHLDGKWSGESIYALVVSCCTLAVVMALYYVERANGQLHRAAFSALSFFAVLWIILACVVTFRGPFITTGNGYFGSWGGAFVSVVAASGARGLQVTDGPGQGEEASDPDL